VPLRDLGVPADWHPHGSRSEILGALGLTAQGVARQVTEWVSGLEADTNAVLPDSRDHAPRG
jgi:1-deoxy-D-xylulose-5-phosphate synthase